MIEEMKYVNITGSADDMGHVVESYLAQYDIQLEYAAKQLHYANGMQPFTGVNPYMETLHKAERLLTVLTALANVPAVHYPISATGAVRQVEAAYQAYEKRGHAQKELENKRDAIIDYIENLRHFSSLNIELLQLESFKHICFRFGRFPVANFAQVEKFLYDDSEVLFLQSHSTREYVYCVYFTPISTRDKIDSIVSALHFERIPLSANFLDEQCPGTPAAIIMSKQNQLHEINSLIASMNDDALSGITESKEQLAAACQKVKNMFHAYDARKYAAITQDNHYVFVGWMTKKDAKALEHEINKDELTFFSRSGETGEQAAADNPPTYLKNPPVIRLFEFFTRMYGIPVYGEIDPTPVMALTYTLLFGLMFGDVGQGLCISLLGWWVYKRFKTDLGGIMVVAGLSSTVFGFLYGSIFGMEDRIPAFWRKPAEDITGMLLFAVGIGVTVIFTAMLLHMFNAVRQRRWGEFFFSPNGLTGMMFYGIILILVVRVMLYGHTLSGLDITLACLPLVFVAFREPLIRIMEGKHQIIEGSIGMFIFSTVLELAEVLLTYITNTISFVRVGAFAISHAGMMSVVLLLSKSAVGTHNPLVMVLGNILVMAIEGLLVGIQVLRLDFYEVFSRFYNGGGHLFESFRTKNP